MNMAIDEAILEAHLAGLVPPTLRFYGFEPAAVTLGYGQKMPAEMIAAIRQRGFDVARRPTGGRAVLHLDDLTYSFVGTRKGKGESKGNGFLDDSIAGAYRQICQGLILGIGKLGIELSLGKAEPTYKLEHDCFLATTEADLHIMGRKMIGSAQVRRHEGVAQHGSILLEQKQSIMSELLHKNKDDVQGEKYFRDRHANLFDVLGKKITIQELEQALQMGFEEAFGHTFAAAALSDREQESALKLQSQYRID